MVEQIATLWRSALDTVDLRDALLFVDDGAAAALAWADSLEALLARGARNVRARRGGGALPAGRRAEFAADARGRALQHLPPAGARRPPPPLSSAGGGDLASALVLCAHSAAAHGRTRSAPSGRDSTRTHTTRTSSPSDGRRRRAGGRGASSSCRPRCRSAAVPSCCRRRARPPESDSPHCRRRPAARARGAGLPRVGGAADVDWSELPADWRRDLGGAALGLAQLTSALRVRPAIFTLGRTATLVGRQLLANLPAAGANDDECGLLIVDRSLDAVAPSLHGAHPLQPLLCAAADGGDADGADGGQGGWVAEAEVDASRSMHCSPNAPTPSAVDTPPHARHRRRRRGSRRRRRAEDAVGAKAARAAR